MKNHLLLGLLCASLLASSQQIVFTPQPGLHLGGTLIAGSGEQSKTAILIIPGSGPTNRDGDSKLITPHASPLKKLAEALSAKGYTTLRIDKRHLGSVQPDTSIFSPKGLRFQDWVADVVAWTHYLKDSVDMQKVILAGHSQGSLVALLAARSGSADGVISLCGAGQPIAGAIANQLKAQLPPAMHAVAVAKFDSLQAGMPVKDSPPMLRSLIGKDLQPFLMSWMKEDPCSALAQLTQPVLVVQGGKDLQVPESEGIALNGCRKSNYTFIPDLNHMLFAIAGDFNENLRSYREPRREVHPQLVEAILTFLTEI